MIAALVVGVGAALTIVAVPAALGARRPLDLVASVGAALGVALAVVGAVACAVPGFFD